MILLNPSYLIFMMIPAIILFFLIINQKSNLNSIFDEDMVKKLTFDNGSLGKTGRNFMLFASLILMIIALSRPVIEKGDVTIKSKKIDLLVALDISKSMLATDIYPNRLEFTKKKLYEFIDSFTEANIGVVAFSSEGFLVSPMTQDSTTLKYLIKNLSLESLSTSGTNLLIPITKAKSFLKDSSQKILIIFTDGGDNLEFKKEIKQALDANIHIYIYAAATASGGKIEQNGVSIKDKQGNIVISKLNEKIKTLALKSGGAYIVGGLKDDSVALLVKDIKDKFKMQDANSKKIKEYKELFYYPLGLALVFMLFAFSSFPRKIGLSAFVLLFFSFSSQSLEASMFDFREIDKAHKAYENEDYKEAIDAYEKVVESKKSSESYYDLANALYKNEQYEEALETYKKVETEDRNLEYKKLFNSGNSNFALKKYEEALKYFEDAKKMKNEKDLENNIKLTKKMIEEKKQDENKEDEEKDKEDEKKDENEEKKDKEDEKNQDEKKDGEEESDKPSKQEEEKEEKISEKEAKKWEEQLEKSKPKTMPMQFRSQEVKKDENEKPW